MMQVYHGFTDMSRNIFFSLKSGAICVIIKANMYTEGCNRMKKYRFIMLSLLSLLIIVLSAFPVSAVENPFEGRTLSYLRYYTSGDTLGAATSQRGFAVSPDGQYLFGGFLSGTKGIVKFSASDGEVLDIYAEPHAGNPKGLAVDDRGIIYAGITNSTQKEYISIAAVSYEKMKLESEKEFKFTDGTVGVNGVAVYKDGEKYYLYAVINYDVEYLCRFDVTDYRNITLDSTFGDGGKYDLHILLENQNTALEGQYIAVDSDGTIYMTAVLATGKKGDTLVKISKDGTVLGMTVCSEGYGVTVWNGLVLVSTYDSVSSCVHVFDKETMTELSLINTENEEHDSLTGIAAVGNTLYVAEQSYKSQSGFWRIKSIVNDGSSTSSPFSGDTSAVILCASAVSAFSAALIITRRRKNRA